MLFFETLERFQRPDAYLVRRNGRYEPISHADVRRRVRHLSLGLQELGFARGDRLAILSENRPEWALTDGACLTIGIADVPIYPTLPADQIPHILNDSGAAAVFVSGDAQAAKIAQVRSSTPGIRHVITFSDRTSPGVDLTLADVEARGARVDSPERAGGRARRADRPGARKVPTPSGAGARPGTIYPGRDAPARPGRSARADASAIPRR